MTSGHIPAHLARQVRRRADELCEYCRLPQASQEATFHVDHTKPKAVGGATKFGNLALACVSCSLRKGAREHARDPESGKLVPLFDPRRHRWFDHFAWTRSMRLRGKTSSGRATVLALRMNRGAVIVIRQQLCLLGYFPPDPAAEM